MKIIKTDFMLCVTAFYRAIFVFLERFDENQREDFLDDLLIALRRLRIGADASGKIFVPFKTVVVFARK